MALKRLRTIGFYFLTFFICLNFTQAQESVSKVTSDLESWNSVRLKSKLNKKWMANLEQGFRFSQNSSVLDQALTELEVAYALTDQLKLKIGNRYIYDKTQSNQYENNFRYNIDASYEQPIKRLDLSLRLRFQSKSEITAGDGDDARRYFRAKLGAEYNFKDWKLDPEISTEVYRSLASDGEIDRLRLTIGTNYSINKTSDISIFYRLENELNVVYPKTTYIVGLRYTYNIKPFKE